MSGKKSQMQVFARLKPCSSIDQKSKRLLVTSRNRGMGIANNSQENFQFCYTDIFDQSSSQDQVFDRVGKPVVLNCLDGYNGTIFAYGQTGSGKTFTMSGADSWQMRGVIPRILSFLFDQIERRNSFTYNIYNENAYDILDKRHIDSAIQNWNKIVLFEDDYGNIHLQNISVHECQNEQDGIDLLMMGNFVRQVSSTPANQCSSRSHCVFTISIEGDPTSNESQIFYRNLLGQEKDSEVCFLSQLHLVDLAGSERISQTQVQGSLLNEAQHINLSLTYLEQVILALNERMKNGVRHHIPYRNSLMTTILQDSLGGNCKTVMIANISCDVQNFEESISTLRFSQRVGQLQNEIRRNEKVDMQAIINRLEQEKLLLIREVEKYQSMALGSKEGVSRIEYSQDQLESQRTTGGSKKNKLNSQFGTRDRETQEKGYHEILEQVDLYLNEKVNSLEVESIDDARICFQAMKQLYNIRMKEYVTELTFISEQLQQYDELLTKKKQIKGNKSPSKEQENYACYMPDEKIQEEDSERYNDQTCMSQVTINDENNNNNNNNNFNNNNGSFQIDDQKVVQQIQYIDSSRKYNPVTNQINEKLRDTTNSSSNIQSSAQFDQKKF